MGSCCSGSVEIATRMRVSGPRFDAVAIGNTVSIYDTTERADATTTSLGVIYSHFGSLDETDPDNKAAIDKAKSAKDPSAFFNCVALSTTNNGRLLAAAGAVENNSILLFDTSVGQPLAKDSKLSGCHDKPVTALVFSPDDSLLYSASGEDCVIAVWNMGSSIITSNKTLRHKTVVTSSAATATSAAIRALAISADGQKLFSAGDDRSIRVFDAVTLTPRSAINDSFASGSILSLATAHNGRVIYCGCSDGVLRIFDQQQRAAETLEAFDGDEVRAVAVSNGASGTPTTLAAAGEKIMLLDIQQSATTPRKQQSNGLRSRDSEGPVNALCFCGHNTLLSADGPLIRAWDASSGLPLGTPMQALNDVTSVAASADGMTIATCGKDGTVRLLCLVRGKLVPEKTLRVEAPVASLQFGDSGLAVIVKTTSGVTSVIELRGGQHPPSGVRQQSPAF